MPDYHGFNATAYLLVPYFEKFDMLMTIITSILTISCIIFNLIIFYVFWGMKKSSNALIFLNLAAVDLFLGFIVMPYSVAILITRPGGSSSRIYSIFCTASGCVFEMTVLCTVGFIFLASADRYLGVYHPIMHRKYLCRRNLLKMVIFIWVAAPSLIISYVMIWIIAASTNWNTFTNLDIFTVCMGEYWWKHDHHALWNIPTYLTGTVVFFSMIIIVLSNLAVLKQLFRSRPSPMVRLQSTAPRKRRNNNMYCTTAPTPQQLTADNVDSETKEQLKKISRAERDSKKSDRIFQTDSNGDITGINITAIMKLYVNSNRAKKKAAERPPRSSNTPHLSPEKKISDSRSLDTFYADRFTPNQCESVVEVEEECQQGQIAGSSEYSELLDDEELVRSVSLSESPNDEDTGEGEDEEMSPDQAILKVIKFIAVLKRNSRKRQEWENLKATSMVDNNPIGHTEVTRRKVLRRSSSESDLNYTNNAVNTQLFKSDDTDSASVIRKYSEFARPRACSPQRPFAYQPFTLNGTITTPTMEEIDEMVIDGELGSLVKCNKKYELVSLVDVIATLKRQTSEAIRHRTSSTDQEDGPGTSRASAATQGPTRTKSTMSWATFAMVNKFRSKLVRSRCKHYVPDMPTETESISSEPELSSEQNIEPRVSAALNTITEEEHGREDSSGSGVHAAGDDVHASNRTLVLSPESTDQQPVITPRDSTASIGTRSRSVSLTRSRSLESLVQQPMSAKRRRGGFLVKPEGSMEYESPHIDMLSVADVGCFRGQGSGLQNAASALKRRVRASSVYRIGTRNSVNMASVAQMVYNFNKQARKKKKEIRAAKTIIILVFYYIITLLLFVVSFYYVSMLDESGRRKMPYWLTFYSYIIYLNAVFNPVIHFWRNARVRHTVLRLCCPRQLNAAIRRWSIRGTFC